MPRYEDILMCTMSMQTAIGVRGESFLARHAVGAYFALTYATWIYANTKSVLLAQLLHVSSTGALFLVVATIALTCGQGLIGTVET